VNPGTVSAACAYLLWGLFPLYFAHLSHVPAVELLAHRVVWTLALLLVVLAVLRRWAWIGPVVHDRRALAGSIAAAALLGLNWGVYVWAVTSGHVLDASLGYFVNPLVSVALGALVLGERLRPVQWVAVGLAAAGVAALTAQAGTLPWVALVLAVSFGVYGLLRKLAPLGAVEGLSLETAVLAPPALVALVWWQRQGTGVFPSADWATNLWLVGTGPVTAAALLLFAAGARRIPLTQLGLLQYLSPTLQFALGVWVFHEPVGAGRLAGFGLIWLALAVYTGEHVRQARRDPARPPPASR
jgi:chloramphenicol-sensitive protein RarD